jgi:hypothetical protein
MNTPLSASLCCFLLSGRRSAGCSNCERVYPLYGLIVRLRRRSLIARLTPPFSVSRRIQTKHKETLADLQWQGADERLKEVCHRLGDEKFLGRVPRWRTS